VGTRSSRGGSAGSFFPIATSSAFGIGISPGRRRSTVRPTTHAVHTPLRFSGCWPIEKSMRDGGYLIMDNLFNTSPRPFPQSVHGRSPLEIAMEAASLSPRQLAGMRLTAGQARLLNLAVEHRLVELLSSCPSA